MLFWIIVILSVIAGAFEAGFVYAKKITRQYEIPEEGRRHLACIGDGLTYGVGVLRERKAFAWPYLLGASLGYGWQVLNYGVSDATVQNFDSKGYITHEAWKYVSKHHYEALLLMLGTNDTQLGIWKEERFKEEFEALLNSLFPIADQVIVLLPPAAFEKSDANSNQKSDVRPKILPQIVQAELDCCRKLQIETVNLYEATKNHPEWFADGIHLNKAGNQALSDAICQALIQII